MNGNKEGPDPGGLALFVVDVWARSLQLPMRHTVGKHFVDGRGVLAWLLPLFWGGLINSPPLLAWSCVYFLSCVLHRIGNLRRWMKGTVMHSRYNGYPWLGVLTRHRLGEITVKTLLEPAVALGMAVLAAPYGDSTFLYFAGGATCMFVMTQYTVLVERRRLDDLNDAAIENDFLMTGFHKRRR